MTPRSITLALLLVTSVAHADPKADAAAAYAEGQQLYVREDYIGAAAKFEAAYRLDADPAYLFNLAQAYRLGARCREAVDSYRRFLAVVPDAPNASDVRGYIAELEPCPEPKPQPVSPPRVPPEAIVTPPPAAVTDRGRGRRRAGWIAIGTGVLAVGAGVGFALHVGSLEDDRRDLGADGVWTEEDTAAEADLERRGDRASLFAVGGFALGGAAIATGAYLVISGRGSERAVAVLPTGRGAMVSFRF